jgi:hypothetical protein
MCVLVLKECIQEKAFSENFNSVNTYNNSAPIHKCKYTVLLNGNLEMETDPYPQMIKILNYNCLFLCIHSAH